MATKSFDDTFRLTEEGASKLIESYKANKPVKYIEESKSVRMASKEDFKRLGSLKAIKVK